MDEARKRHAHTASNTVCVRVVIHHPYTTPYQIYSYFAHATTVLGTRYSIQVRPRPRALHLGHKGQRAQNARDELGHLGIRRCFLA